jgi:hypothetical protein
MAQITEKLPQEILDTLISSQNKANELVLTLGQIHLRIRDLNIQKERLEAQIDDSSKEFGQLLNDLEQKYPKGEVDLNQGVVIYESAE